MEPIPLRSTASVINSCDRADAVHQQTNRLDAETQTWLLMPCTPMPLSEDRRTNISVRPRLITSLTGFHSHFFLTGLIPHPTRKAALWGTQPQAISNAVLQPKRLTDSESYETLKQVESVECGLIPPLLRRHHFDSATGKHVSIAKGCPRQDDQFWIRQPETTSKAASAAGPPTWTASNSVSGLPQQFEQLSMKRSASASAGRGHIPESASAPCHPIVLKHDEISMDLTRDTLVLNSLCRRWVRTFIGH